MWFFLKQVPNSLNFFIQKFNSIQSVPGWVIILNEVSVSRFRKFSRIFKVRCHYLCDAAIGCELYRSAFPRGIEF